MESAITIIVLLMILVLNAQESGTENLVSGIRTAQVSPINHERGLGHPKPPIRMPPPSRESSLPTAIRPHFNGIYNSESWRNANRNTATHERPRVVIDQPPAPVHPGLSTPNPNRIADLPEGNPVVEKALPEINGSSNNTDAKVDDGSSSPDRGFGIEAISGTSANTDNDGHDHDHDHDHMDKVSPDLGTNIVPLQPRDMHKHDAPDSHAWATADNDMSNNRTDKSINDHDLCEYCLCNKNRAHVSCKRGNTFRTITNLNLTRHLIPPSAVTIEVKDFDTVIIMPETFSNQDSVLQHIIFENIARVELYEKSLHFSPHSRENMRVLISLVNCNIPVVPSSTLTQLEVDSDHSREEHNLALEKTRFITLRMLGGSIGEMESRAFNRARLLFFNFTDVSINSMSPKSIDVDVYEDLIIQHCNLPHLPANAVCLHASKSVVFSRNVIQELDSYAWAIEAGGQVLFEYNTVKKIRGSAFLKIKPMKDSRSSNIVFLNNTVHSGDANALVISDLYPQHERKVLNNRFHIICECNISIHFERMLDINPNDSYSRVLNEAVLADSLCLPFEGSHWYVKIGSFLKNECSPMPVLLIIASTVVIAIILTSVTVAVICAKKAKKAQEEISYLGETSSRSFSTINTHAAPTPLDSKYVYYDSQGKPSWIMAVPELKTYQETEVHVTYEESQPIASSTRNSCQEYMLEMQRRNLTRQSCPFN
ncbi:uncharacterized protein LOC108676634 [Hyalella azteca]|uniref:Uncharacterized protein LOC108676634 n=1 Tax=Hyalella azteca TaxID=294128 RepID=A0A8B7P2A2_HYAAZ|nr:uncharacterized protein LOC108676634 [Hyalella azteca]